MVLVYLGAIMVCRIVQALYSKRASIAVNNTRALFGYSGFKNLISALAGLAVIIIAGNGFKFSLLTLLISAASGICLFMSGFCSLYAVKSGTIALSSMCGTAGMIIPVVAGIIWDIPVKPLQWVAMLIFFVAAALLILDSKKAFSGFTVKTCLLLVGALLFNGLTMLSQQLFTRYQPEGDVSVFSLLSFGIVAVASLITAVLIPKNKNAQGEAEDGSFLTKELVTCGILLAVAVFIINQFATICTALVSPIILFTVINGGATVISTVVAAIKFGEPITVKKTAGIVLGIISLVAIKLFA